MTDEGKLASWTTYLSAWGPVSAAERQDLLRRSVSEQCIYTDPTDECHDVGELIARMEQTQARFPGSRITNDKLLAHDMQSLSYWTMVDGDGVLLTPGNSYARYGEDGRLVQMSGFYEV